MKYKCENELNTLSFKDFTILEIKYENDKFTLMTNGAVVKYDNSCNETLEERYISETTLTFVDAKITKFVLEGGKYYTADDVLIKEVPDTEVNPAEYNDLFKKFLENEGTVFFVGEKSGEGHVVEIAIDVVNDTYWITVEASKIIAGFDRFMNRVMN